MDQKDGSVRRGYPRAVQRWSNPPQRVADEDWLPQVDADELLGIALPRVGFAIACENLDPAENRRGKAGVTLASVEREIEWRSTATVVSRLRRIARNTLH